MIIIVGCLIAAIGGILLFSELNPIISSIVSFGGSLMVLVGVIKNCKKETSHKDDKTNQKEVKK